MNCYMTGGRESGVEATDDLYPEEPNKGRNKILKSTHPVGQ